MNYLQKIAHVWKCITVTLKCAHLRAIYLNRGQLAGDMSDKRRRTTSNLEPLANYALLVRRECEPNAREQKLFIYASGHTMGREHVHENFANELKKKSDEP